MLLRSPDELGFDPNQVTPGWIGFTATALVAAVIMLLLWDFNRRVRRINNRAEAKERIEAELAERDAAARADDAASPSEAGSDASGAPGGGVPAPADTAAPDERDRATP